MIYQLMTKEGVQIGSIQEVNKGFVWFGLGRSGKTAPDLSKAISGARNTFGKTTQVYNPETFEYL
jgi:hypothetical protein